MFSQMTIVQVVLWVAGILFGGGTIAVLLQRWFPYWDRVPVWAKNILIAGFNQLGGFIIAGVLGLIPAAVQGMTVEQVITGLFMAAASYLIHFLDQVWQGKSIAAKNTKLLSLNAKALGPQTSPGQAPGYPAR